MIVRRSPLPMHWLGWGSCKAGATFSWGFIFLPANSSDGWAYRLCRSAGPGVEMLERCWLHHGTCHGLGMQSPGVTAMRPLGHGDVGLTWGAPCVFVTRVLSDVVF